MRNKKVIRQERGWIGHFILADRCLFRRNTLLTCGEVNIVVSTVGLLKSPYEADDEFYHGPFEHIGSDGYYETMVFYSRDWDTRFRDIDVSRTVYFSSPGRITELDADDRANDMHEAVVDEITARLKSDEL